MAEPIKFFFDQHIPDAVASALTQRGIDVLTAFQAGRCGLQDSEQLAFSLSEQRVVVSFDPDYLALAASGASHAGIAWCPATKYSIGQLIQALLMVHGVLSADDMKNGVEYL